MESAPPFLKQEISEYISVLNNLLIGYGTLEQFEQVLKLLEKLKAVQTVIKDDILKIHRQYYMNYFSYCIRRRFEEGRKL